jgi:alkylation response protein AidB-like acyl-CoA dehydrogenase
MLTMTRLHNSIAAASGMRRMVNMARDYSTRRQAFGSVLKDYPLHMQTLARMEVLEEF